MAIQIYTRNTGPELRYAGATEMARGIRYGMQDGGAALAEAFSRKKEEQKRLAQNAKIADSIVKNNPDLLGQMKMSPEEFQIQSAKDKTALVEGAITASTLKTKQLQTKQLEEILGRQGKQRMFLEHLLSNQPGNTPSPVSNEVYEQRANPEARIAEAIKASDYAPPVLDTMKLAEEFRQAMAPPMPTSPTVTELPGGAYAYNFPGTKVAGVYTGRGRGADAEPTMPFPRWVYTGTDEEFSQQLQLLPTRQEQEAVVKARNDFMRKKDEMAEIMKWIMQDDPSTKNPSKSNQAAKPNKDTANTVDDYRSWKKARSSRTISR